MKKYLVRKEISEKLKENLKEFKELTQILLVSRGIEDPTSAKEFLNPDYELHTHDPFLLNDMEKSVSRILKAIKNKEHIVIYSDYDCDGIPGGVIIHDFFKKIKYENFSNYIPCRHEEGYGLNPSAIKKVAKDDAKLLITVDCGITDVKPVELANSLGIDVIITDHHLQNGKLPKAYAIVNPKLKNNKYPYEFLCGAGVAFKLVQALIIKGDFKIINGWNKWLLDMAGLSTIADMVPLTGENRVLAHYGLKVLRKSRRPGLQQLCKKIKVNQKHITEGDIGFMIAPRINAASRMDHPMEAFKLLTTEDITEAGVLSDYLQKLNNERKGIVASMVKEAKKKINNFDKEKEVIVLGNPDWVPALLGLVANSVVEEFKKPVFLWGRKGGKTIKGSCRSDESVNVVELMASTKELFIDAGGHAFAGGFSVIPEKIHVFEKEIISAYNKLKTKTEKKIYVDKKLSINDVSWDTYRIVEQFAPFGEENQNPMFLFEDIIIDEVKHFGKEKNHLQLGFKKNDGKLANAIGFFKTSNDFDKKIEEGGKINLVASLEKSMFRNFPELRMRIVDIY